jgi:hypothetical protein
MIKNSRCLARIFIYPYDRNMIIIKTVIKPTSMYITESLFALIVLISSAVKIPAIGSKKVSTGMEKSFRTVKYMLIVMMVAKKDFLRVSLSAFLRRNIYAYTRIKEINKPILIRI